MGVKCVEEVNGLIFECIDEDFDVFFFDVICYEDIVGDVDAVFAGRGLVEFVYMVIMDEWCVKGGEIVIGGDDWYMWDFDDFVLVW